MRRVVLDASAFLAWFGPQAVRRLRDEYEAGSLEVVVSSGFSAAVLEAAARLGWDPDRLRALAPLTARVPFDVREPRTDELVRWLGRGLSGPQAGSAAVAEALGIPLVSGDAELARTAASLLLRDDD
ncbi:MAG: PIN domain-containing protein [Candidatus Limnocylindria bacterium]